MKTARTAIEARVTTESLVPKIEEKVVEGVFDYTPKKNAELLTDAHEWVDKFIDVKEAGYCASLRDTSHFRLRRCAAQVRQHLLTQIKMLEFEPILRSMAYLHHSKKDTHRVSFLLWWR